jgi:hypothetical protein
MYHFATALSAGIIATVLVSGTAFMPTPADAAKMSNAESVALKQATVACKVEAKGRKIMWPASRKYVKNCITMALSPTIDINQVRSTVNMQGLPHQRSLACDPMC